MRLLFVCTGNTCRSPMAEAYFNYLCKKNAKPCHAKSAGIAAFSGQVASDESVTAMKELFGIDMSSHRSQSLNSDQVRDADLVLTMTRTHRAILKNKLPEYQDKIYTICEFVQKILENPEKLNSRQIENSAEISLEIPDPYGQDLDVYRITAAKIARLVDLIYEEITKNDTKNDTKDVTKQT